MDRHRLPTRRPHEVVEFMHGRIAYSAGVGTYEDGRLGEVFLRAGRAGTEIDAHARDASVLLSLALQHGATINTIRGALTREEDGSASGPVGILLDMLAAELGEA
ncbi:hypothetical protein V5F77_02600 [Xanthobacter sp. DSM 24535]|uniref:TSCPD domain-containing protein n=1 Tax=Roseixanthobacter psychrophilus TaxID=3119917 RepID=UPI003728308B